MLVFPQLVTGVVALYPVTKRLAARTVTHPQKAAMIRAAPNTWTQRGVCDQPNRRASKDMNTIQPTKETRIAIITAWSRGF